MAFNSGTVTLGEATKKSHFDQLLSNMFSILRDAHTFVGTKTFNSGTVFTFAPSFPAGTIGSSEIATGNVRSTHIGNAQVDSQHYVNNSIDHQHINWGTGANQVNTDYVSSGSLNKFMRQGVTQTFTGNKNLSGTISFYSTVKIDEITTNSSTDSVAVQAIHRSATAGTEATVFLKKKIIEIGGWDMDADNNKYVSHGLSDGTKIRLMHAIIQNDSSSSHRPLTFAGSIQLWDGTNMLLSREASGAFDGILYDDDTMNRGWVYLEYEV